MLKKVFLIILISLLIPSVSIASRIGVGGGSGGATSLTGLSDVSSATVTAGDLLIANGTTFDSVTLSGDLTVNKDGVVSLATDSVGDNEIDYTEVTLGDFTNDAGYATSLTGLSDVSSDTATAGRLLVSNGSTFNSVDTLYVSPDSSGSVGVGTATPAAKLHSYLSGLTFTSLTGTSVVAQNSVDTDSDSSIEVIAGNDGTASLYLGIVSNPDHGSVRYDPDEDGAVDSSMYFLVDSSEVARFKSDRVGIAETAPAYRMEIKGDVGSGYVGITDSANGDVFAIIGNGNVGVNTNSPDEAFHVFGITKLQGGLLKDIAKKLINYLIKPVDYTIILDGSNGTVTGTLPAAPNTGQEFRIKCIDSTNTVTVARNGKNIEGATNNLTMIAGQSIVLQYDGTEWWITANKIDATESVQTGITGSATVPLTSLYIQVESDSGEKTLAGSPKVQSCRTVGGGKVLIFEGTSDTETLVFTNGGGFVMGSSFTAGDGDTIGFICNEADDEWVALFSNTK